MVKYTIKRIFLLIPVMLGVMLVVFLFQAVSNDDPVAMLLGFNATPDQVAALTKKLGLDQPIFVQYIKYVWNFFIHFDLGTSYTSGRPVLIEIMQRFPYTVKLAIGSVLIGMVLGLPLGILSAVKQYSFFDNATLVVSVFLSSFPQFWFALLLIILFSVKLGWLPSNGVATWKSWILPMAVVGIGSMTALIRTTRSSMLETIRQDYIMTARAKGQTEYKVIAHHAVRNASIPVANAVGNMIGGQLGGSIIIETVFGVPGIGQYAVQAISTRNYPAVLGSIVILAFIFAVINLILDLIYTVIDPKLKMTFVSSASNRKNKRLLAAMKSEN